jgi:hypothetical protein
MLVLRYHVFSVEKGVVSNSRIRPDSLGFPAVSGAFFSMVFFERNPRAIC